MFIIRKTYPYVKTGDATKGGGGYEIDFPKTFSNPFFFMRNVLITSLLDNKVKVFKSPKS